jgi:EmrB/QacA subfamily drug resistance transporter
MNKNILIDDSTSTVNKKERRLILITVCIALMAVIASVSGLNVAQGKLTTTFNASQNSILWIINIYTMSLAALLLPLGALGDRIGRRKILLIGLIIFGIGSVISGFAISTPMMLLARLLSGIGAAMIMPVTLAVITSTFPVEERSQAIGIWTGVAGGGGILGMYLSAILVDFADWRWLFLLPVLLTLVSIILTIKIIPESKEHNNKPFDRIGSLLSAVAIIGFVYALNEIPNLGWQNIKCLVALLSGATGLIGFIFWELNHPAPLLNMQYFSDKKFSAGTLSLLVLFGVQAGIFVVLFPFFQGVLGWSGLRSTLGMMPMAVLMMLAAGLAPKLTTQLGRKAIMAAGVFLSSLGAALMAIFVSIVIGYISILPGILVMGLGMGLTMTPSTEAITSSLPLDRQGVASAMNDITRELGTALGIALLGGLVTARYSVILPQNLHGVSSDVLDISKQGLANALAVATKYSDQSHLITSAARSSFVESWQYAIWVGAFVMGSLFIYIILRGPKKSKFSQVKNHRHNN